MNIKNRDLACILMLICSLGASYAEQNKGADNAFQSEKISNASNLTSESQIKNDYLSLLKAHQYDELDRKVNAAQQDYKTGKIDDLQLQRIFNHFSVYDPTLELSFNEWVQKYPQSYAARVALGIYFISVGQHARGSNYMNNTSETQIAALQTALAKANSALIISLKLDSKPLLSYAKMQTIMKYYSDDSSTLGSDLSKSSINDPLHPRNQRDLLQDANDIDPHNFIARYDFMFNLQTR